MDAISTKVSKIKAGKKTKMIKDFKMICETGDVERGYFSLTFIQREHPQSMEMIKKRMMKATKINNMPTIYIAN
jgi:hypothetical protein